MKHMNKKCIVKKHLEPSTKAHDTIESEISGD